MYIEVNLYTENQRTQQKFEDAIRKKTNVHLCDRYKGTFLLNSSTPENLIIELPCKGEINFNRKQRFRYGQGADPDRRKIKGKLKTFLTNGSVWLNNQLIEYRHELNQRQLISEKEWRDPQPGSYAEYREQRQKDFECLTKTIDMVKDAVEKIQNYIQEEM